MEEGWQKGGRVEGRKREKERGMEGR